MEISRVLLQEFNDDFLKTSSYNDEEAPEQILNRQRRQLIEGEILDDQQLCIRLLRDQAENQSIRSSEGIQSRVQYAKGLFRFGAIDEGIEILMQLVSHHQDHIELR